MINYHGQANTLTAFYTANLIANCNNKTYHKNCLTNNNNSNKYVITTAIKRVTILILFHFFSVEFVFFCLNVAVTIKQKKKIQ